MLLELHIVQSFAPSNLNRDETGSPKDCEFGGCRRARISSQCLKRAMRTTFGQMEIMPEANRAVRTKRVAGRLAEMLAAQGKDPAAVATVVERALAACGLALDQDRQTQYLLFLGQVEITRLAEACLTHWDTLADTQAAGARPAAGGREAKKAARAGVPVEVKAALDAILDGGGAADLALFGRMLADRPEKNVDAACQVAHAISTHRAGVEFDFYTAVDDLKQEDSAGAGMMGTVEFNSACFYRYANVDLGQLRSNLKDSELAAKTALAFVRAAVAAVPSGKQNSMGAQNPPSFVLAVLRRRGLWSLANAFLKPVRADAEADLVERSVAALDAYWGKLVGMYGDASVAAMWCASLDEAGLANLKASRLAGFDALLGHLEDALATAVREGAEGGRA